MPSKPFYKFPSTPYLIQPVMGAVRQDKILTDDEAEPFFSKCVTIEEKIDGANLGISFDSDGIIQTQNRGHYIMAPYSGQWKPLSSWLSIRESVLFDELVDRYVLFGEWCYFTHSVTYNALPDWFIAFDIFDKKDKQFLSVPRRNHLIGRMGLALVPQIFHGHITREMISTFFDKSEYGEEKSEGLYFRIDSGACLMHRAKCVRSDFSQSIETHWSKKTVTKNQLRAYAR